MPVIARHLGTVLVTVLLLACAPSTDGGGIRGEVIVSGAASLTDVLEELASAFETDHPEVDVVLNLGGSSALREQILAGAPVDVFAPADVREFLLLEEAGLTDGAGVVFATNLMVVAVPAGNPASVTGLADLADEALFVGLCAEEVPCGRTARRVLESAGIVPTPDTLEPDVRALLTRLEEGELDVGMVYASDLLAAAGRVEMVVGAVPPDAFVEYPAGRLTQAPNPEAADEFVAFLTSPEAAEVLRAAGFGVP